MSVLTTIRHRDALRKENKRREYNVHGHIRSIPHCHANLGGDPCIGSESRYLLVVLPWLVDRIEKGGRKLVFFFRRWLIKHMSHLVVLTFISVFAFLALGADALGGCKGGTSQRPQAESKAESSENDKTQRPTTKGE